MDAIQATIRLQFFVIIDRFPGKISDVSYSTFPEDYTSTDIHKWVHEIHEVSL